MILTRLLQNNALVQQIRGTTKLEIRGISYDSRQIQPGYLFIAVRGLVSDGHDFIQQAVDAGAIAIVYDRKQQQIPANLTAILVTDSRRMLPQVAADFYGHPEAGLKLVAITGTNGKTSTNYFVQHLLTATGLLTGRIGTTGANLENRDLELMHTTPESADIFALLADFVARGARAMTLEVSSHALAQNRVDGLNFDVAIFTNLTQDHLDYHGSMDNYLNSKRLLFSDLNRNALAIVNADDPASSQILEGCQARIIRFGCNPDADYRLLDYTVHSQHAALSLQTPQGPQMVMVNTIGTFNYYNFLAAYAAAAELGAQDDLLVQAARSLPVIPGRLELIKNTAPYLVFVDYAHTPDAMETVLKTLIEAYPDRSLITVFGCGGDRDQGKRPLMGDIATRLSTRVIITDDNPRSETSSDIIAAIVAGCSERDNYQVLPDRKTAILTALQEAPDNSVLAILGKGHETYQEINGIRKPFSDMNIINAYMEQHGYSA